MDSSEFSRYILDCMKYSVNIDVVHEQLNYLRKVNDGMQLTPSQLDEKIAENNVRVAKVTTELTEKQIELLKLKNELRALQFAEAQSKCAKTVHDDGKWLWGLVAYCNWAFKLISDILQFRPQLSAAHTTSRYETVPWSSRMRPKCCKSDLDSHSN